LRSMNVFREIPLGAECLAGITARRRESLLLF
jgi:hypothetical protein